MNRPLLPPPSLTAELPSPELPEVSEPPPPPPSTSKLPRGTNQQPPLIAESDPTPQPGNLPEPPPPHSALPRLPRLYARLPERPDTAQLPAVDLDLASSRLRVRGTPRGSTSPGDQIRTLVFAPEPTRAAWIERELSHTPITVQVGRSARNVVAALTRDPAPRPDVLVVDFDAISPAELAELHKIRPGGWFGRLIGLGHVPPELRAVLGIAHALAPPLVRD